MHGQVKVEAGQRLCHGIDILAALDPASLGGVVLGGSWLLGAVVVVVVVEGVVQVVGCLGCLGWVVSSFVHSDRRRKDRAPLEDGNGG